MRLEIYYHSNPTPILLIIIPGKIRDRHGSQAPEKLTSFDALIAHHKWCKRIEEVIFEPIRSFKYLKKSLHPYHGCSINTVRKVLWHYTKKLMAGSNNLVGPRSQPVYILQCYTAAPKGATSLKTKCHAGWK